MLTRVADVKGTAGNEGSCGMISRWTLRLEWRCKGLTAASLEAMCSRLELPPRGAKQADNFALKSDGVQPYLLLGVLIVPDVSMLP